MRSLPDEDPLDSRFAKSRGSPRNVALGSVYCPLPSASAEDLALALKGRNAGSASSSSSAKDEAPSWCGWKRGGRRMMRDCAGLDAEDEDEAAELDSAGPGDGGSAGAAAVVGVGVGEIGSDVRRVLCCFCGEAGRFAGGCFRRSEPVPTTGTAVPVDDAREACGRPPSVVPLGVPGMLPSFLGTGTSLRMDSDEGVLP